MQHSLYFYAKKIFKTILILGGCLIFVSAIVIGVFAYTNSVSQKADYVVVMGAAIHSPALYGRAKKALELYEEGKADGIVLTGGKLIEADISEAQDAQRYLQKIAKKPINIVLEDQSGTTYENLKNTKEKIGADKSIIIVSDSYHIARSVLTAKAVGFKKVYWSSIDSSYYPKRELVFHYFREIAGIIDYLPKFFGFKMKT